MADIDKTLSELGTSVKIEGPDQELEIEKQEEALREPVQVTPTEDGGVELDFDPSRVNIEGQPNHFDNLAALLPDSEGDLGDVEDGLESIDEILDLLAKDGTEYTVKELKEMGINIPEKDLPIRSDKAEGGIIAGVSSGPPPTSGPTPHGLSYVAKNVTPIKERK